MTSIFLIQTVAIASLDVLVFRRPCQFRNKSNQSEKGFSVSRTQKSFADAPADKSLKQTIHGNAKSWLICIMTFADISTAAN